MPGATDTGFAAAAPTGGGAAGGGHGVEDSLIFNMPGARALGLVMTPQAVAHAALDGALGGGGWAGGAGAVASVTPGPMNWMYVRLPPRRLLVVVTWR